MRPSVPFRFRGDPYPPAKLAWGLITTVAFVAALVAGIARILTMEALIRGEYSISPWRDVYPVALAGLRAAVLGAALAIGVAWVMDRSPRLVPSPPHPAGFALLLAGAFLGISLGGWATLADADDVDGFRLIAMVSAVDGFAWPLVVLGLGILTFVRKRVGPLPLP